MSKLIKKNFIQLIGLLMLSMIALEGCITGGGGSGAGGGSANVDLVSQMRNNIPSLGDDVCGLGIESPAITSNDCITYEPLFYDGKDHSIAYILKHDGNWSDDNVEQLLSKQTVEERYAYFITHNQGPLNLQCDKGLEPTEQSCKPALFGNTEFQIDYLLCPNLANKFLISVSDHWTVHLNKVFIYCAANKILQNQCQSSPSTVLIATPDSLRDNGRYTYTAREMCMLTNKYNLNIFLNQSQTRYNIFYLQ